jgi:hypothetical protein
MDDRELQRSIEVVQGLLRPLRQSQFSDNLGKISVYVKSVGKSWEACCTALADLERIKDDDPEKHRQARETRIKGFESSLKNSLRFAHINLDAAMVQALESLVRRPRSANKVDEQKRSQALQKTFDRLADPAEAMLEHFSSSSDPLNKYLVAGPWGHEYLRRRKIDLEDYDRELCEVLGCGDLAAGRVVLAYSGLSRAIVALEEQALKNLADEMVSA